MARPTEELIFENIDDGDILRRMGRYAEGIAENQVNPSVVCSFVADWLTNNPNRSWTLSEVLFGLDPVIYSSAAELPASPAVNPSFAIIIDGITPKIQIAYWNGTSWGATTFPWDYPFLLAGHVINQVPANGTGNNVWNFSMGSEFRIEAAGNINDMSIKLGPAGAGSSHVWEVRKSTVTGPTAPSFATYTTIAATGTLAYTLGNIWQSVGGFPAIPTLADEWYLAYFYVAGVGGQLDTIANLRSGGQLVEDFATLQNGVYNLTALPGPGTIPLPLPTTRIGTTIYGVASLEMGP